MYVGARAPDVGEDHSVLARASRRRLNIGLVYEDRFGRLTEQAFVNDFANWWARPRPSSCTRCRDECRTRCSAKRRLSGLEINAVLVCLARQDRTISPELERFLATRMDASTIEIDAGHLSLITHPDQVANLILRAARATKEPADRHDQVIQTLVRRNRPAHQAADQGRVGKEDNAAHGRLSSGQSSLAPGGDGPNS